MSRAVPHRVGKAVQTREIRGGGVADFPRLDDRGAVGWGSGGGQRQAGARVVGQHVDQDRAVPRQGRAVGDGGGRGGDRAHGDRHARGGAQTIGVAHSISERIGAGEIRGRGVSHLTVLDRRRAMRRGGDADEREAGAAIVGQHVDQGRGALVDRGGVADRDRPGGPRAADGTDRDRGRMRAKGDEGEIEHQGTASRDPADIHRHGMRDRQIEAAVQREPRHRHARRQEHGAVGLEVQQIVGARQAQGAQY